MATPIGNNAAFLSHHSMSKPQREIPAPLSMPRRLLRQPSTPAVDEAEPLSPMTEADRRDTENLKGWSGLLQRVYNQTTPAAEDEEAGGSFFPPSPRHPGLNQHRSLRGQSYHTQLADREMDLPTPDELANQRKLDFVPYYEDLNEDAHDTDQLVTEGSDQLATRANQTVTRATDPSLTKARGAGSSPVSSPVATSAAIEAFKRAGKRQHRAPTEDVENGEPIALVEKKDAPPSRPADKRPALMSAMKAMAASGASLAGTGNSASSITHGLEPPPAHQADRARGHWANAKQKAKALTSANVFLDSNARRRDLHAIASSHTLVPFFAPAISVPYFWMARDEKNRRPPPVIMDALSLAITDSEVEEGSLKHHWIFRMELEYGDIKWVVKRSFSDFWNLYATLLFKARVIFTQPHPPPFPNQIYYFYDKVVANVSPSAEDRADRRGRNAKERRKALEDWLVTLIKANNMRVNYDLCEFLEISAISITKDMGWKGKEGYLENKIDFVMPTFCQFFKFGSWSEEWVMLRDSYIAFCTNIGSTTPTDVFLFDKTFQVSRDNPHLLTLGSHHHLTLKNKFRRIDIKGPNNRAIDEWLESIQRVQEISPWVRVQRFNSFAPVRENAKVKWYVDGKDYFHAISEAILAAKNEIYIEDWWLSPELYLRRPASKYPEFRLDRLLQRKAEEGIMIYIVVYKEMSYALTLNSVHTKSWMQGLHRNITVQRNPDHGADGVLFWAHHEKMLIVDYRLAFIGGLDLCFGRFDTHKHKLCDNHPGNHSQIWPGQDYSNPRIKDFANVEHHEVPLINKANTPRMPWHDVTIGMVGPPARDVARHFVQRWNFIKASKGMHRSSVPFLTPKGEFVAAREESKFKGTCRVQVIRSSAEWSSGVEREHSIYNAYVECIMNAQHFIYIENQFFVTATQSDDKNVVKNKIGQAIVERIKRAHKEKKKFRIIVVMPLAPGFEGDFASSESATMRLVMHWQYVSMSRGGSSVIEKLRLEKINPDDYISFFSLRSHDKFEVPVSEHSPTKMSPGQSRFAEHGRNQSYDPLLNSPANNLNGSGVPVDDKAQVEDATASPTAISPKGSRSSFDTKRKSVVSQNLTETTSQTSVADTIETTPPEVDIKTGKRMTHRPTESVTTINPLDGRDNYVTEELYVHSKLLIVDDRIVICGSANLNDRSQLGNRDSEIAMIIEDEDTVHTRMNGKRYVAAKFAHSLRCQLFKEHLGLLHHEDEELLPNNNEPAVKAEQLDGMNARDKGNNISVTAVLNVRTPTPSTYDLSYGDPMSKEDMLISDPLSDSFYQNTWLRTAQMNTQVFREVFRCVPDDTVTSFEEYRNFVPDPTKVRVGHVARPEMTASDIQERLNLVKGHLVIFPTEFLKKENLIGSALKETMIPMEIFT